MFKVNNEKFFRTFDEQIKLLSSRGIIIPDTNLAINVLKRENYYSVINGYKQLFLATTQSTECYLRGTTFNEITALYNFDRRLREIFLIELLRVEKVIKTSVTYTFSKYHGHNHNEYLSASSFNSVGKRNQELSQKLINELNSMIIHYSAKHKAISFYLNTHGYIPMWVLSSVTSFGTLNYFFSRMLLIEKQEIADEFNMSVKNFESVLHILCSFRNKCAHGERIYSYRKDIVKSHFIPVFSYHSLLNIPSNEKGPKYGREDVLALLIVLKFLISPARYSLLIAQIETQLNILSAKLNVISINDVMKVMGLVPNWTDLKNLQ